MSGETLLALVRHEILGGAANPGLVADGVIVPAMQDRSAKGKTFDFLEPKGLGPKQSTAGLDAVLARCRCRGWANWMPTIGCC